MVKPIVSDEEDLAPLLNDKRITAVLIGPGAGVGPKTASRTLQMLKSGKSVVLDADALSSFKDDPTLLFEASSKVPCVFTPHEGEFKRIFSSVIKPNDDKMALSHIHL
eukprot:TRINITY_DN20213_c0_g1_i1.p2 TRINITY_DN20213_c0_g1~~TRINITY_DN20213_c0_g1_i1.p2  ORF type:complete len:108 (+),score=16.61 TRINITY_DN20213_c0_g1_i1:188-511(+)